MLLSFLWCVRVVRLLLKGIFFRNNTQTDWPRPKGWWIGEMQFWIASVFTMTWPYRWCLQRKLNQDLDGQELKTYLRGVLVFKKFPSIRARLQNRRANSAQACNTVYWNLHGWIVFAWLNETSTFW